MLTIYQGMYNALTRQVGQAELIPALKSLELEIRGIQSARGWVIDRQTRKVTHASDDGDNSETIQE